MRGVTAVVVLVLGACSTAGGDTTTTTPPLAEPSTTTTASPSTTTVTEPTTTTTVAECVERDGVQRTDRGFICPPHLAPLESESHGYLPGTYTTRLLRPALRFSQPDRFRSHGESPVLAILDHDGSAALLPRQGMAAIGGSAADGLFGVSDTTPRQHDDGWDWAIAETPVREVQTAGTQALGTSFVTRCWDGVSDPTRISNLQCSFSLPDSGLPGGSWTYLDGQRVTQFLVDTQEGSVLIEIRADEEDADTYWAEVARPILDSIEFLDP